MAKSFLRFPARKLLMSLFLSLSLMIPVSLSAQDLGIAQEDLLIELRPDGGFHLFIRHKPDISSVLLTETTRDPLFREANFAYRAAEWNEINGDEIRLIDGVPVRGIYSLVSSTPTWHPDIGWAYHIYIPYRVLYGHEGGRHGEVHVGDGMYLNIRAFYYAHADYRGPFQDNPFVLRISQEFTRPPPLAMLPPPTAPAPPPGRRFLTETISSFTSLAGAENTSFAALPGEMMDQVRSILAQVDSPSVDIVICLDVTGSMRAFFNEIRLHLIPTVQAMVADFDSVRVGMVFYKDYDRQSDFLYMVIPFTTDFGALQRSINTVRVGGGGDIPEAVHEALYAGATQLAWEGETRIMILIGDAPPHPRPRGSVTRAMVDAEIERQGIELHAIILPHP
ncbi:MAG: VWA domain-containing protein [Treponema sp.]|nr:VWA domain-containing protein [Treponema sp.]